MLVTDAHNIDRHALTKGFVSLLTQKRPRHFSLSDLDNYRQMFFRTKHHSNAGGTHIKLRRGRKYTRRNVIHKLFHMGSMEKCAFPLVTSTPIEEFSPYITFSSVF